MAYFHIARYFGQISVCSSQHHEIWLTLLPWLLNQSDIFLFFLEFFEWKGNLQNYLIQNL